MSLIWLIVLVVIIMLSGLVATMVIGQSKSNKEENPDYDRNTGKNWTRLISIYAAVIIAVAVILIALLNQ